MRLTRSLEKRLCVSGKKLQCSDPFRERAAAASYPTLCSTGARLFLFHKYACPVLKALSASLIVVGHLELTLIYLSRLIGRFC